MHLIPRREFIHQSARVLGGSLVLGSTVSSAGDDPATGAKDLIFRTENPRNAEPALTSLVESWITPARHFYVRSHAPVPQIDTGAFRLSVEGLVERPLELSLEELSSRFPGVSALTTMTCAGNRRTEHNAVQKVGGVQWQAGAIGNAEWGGVRLSDVLRHAGIRDEARHVWFEGLDQIDRKTAVIPFGGSIPVEKAMEDTPSAAGAMLATTMNGEPLPPDHGYPLRTVVPGYIGARSVKWLGRIVVSNRPSPNHYLATAYKLVREGTPIEWAESGPIYRYPVNSVICAPAAGGRLSNGRVTVRGYALPSGLAGATVSRVEVSSDGGGSWTRARVTTRSSEFCWALWTAEVAVTADTDRLMVRASDTAGNTQPQTVAWNMKGYLFNAWHSIPVSVN